jgi:hypothetical protein
MTTPAGTRPKASPRRRHKPALLSGLVFPGLGQLVSGHPFRALGFGGGTVLLLVLVVRRVARETLARMPQDLSAIDVGLPFRLAVEIQRANAGFFLWATIGVVVLWVGSILDAWYAERKG